MIGYNVSELTHFSISELQQLIINADKRNDVKFVELCKKELNKRKHNRGKK